MRQRGTGEITQQIRAFDVLPEVPSSGPSIHLRKLITTVPEDPQDPMPFSRLYRHTQHADANISIHTT